LVNTFSIVNDNDHDNLTKYVSKLNSMENNEMLVARVVTIQKAQYIAVCLYGGFKLWSFDGNRLLFNIPLKVKLDSEIPYAFTAVAQYEDSIVCSDNLGNIHLVSGSGTNFKSKIVYLNSTPVSLVTSNKAVYVAFSNGEIHGLRPKTDDSFEAFAKLSDKDNLKLPILSIDILNDEYLVAGMFNGEVRLYSLTSLELVYSIASHLRLITSIKCCRNYIFTAGDDCFVNIWKYSDGLVSLYRNIEITDKMPVGIGVSVLNKKVELYITSYDSPSFAYIDNLNI
jgi:WD40 repeat protein